MIEMNKKYKTRSGMSVRILCVDIKAPMYTVVAAVFQEENKEEAVISLTSNGEFIKDEQHDFDLIEVTPYDDLKEDDLCVVWVGDIQLKEFRYFAEVKSGIPYFFDNGQTSFTAKGTTSWTNCRKATEEEIRTKTIKD